LRFFGYQTVFYLVLLNLVIAINLQKFYPNVFMEDQEELKLKLTEYKEEHKMLDETIDRLMDSDQPVNLFHMQQLKKKKLWLKDMIQKIESGLIDDIIA